MNRLETHKEKLYELRFSPMCKPAAEVANLTQLESHTTRARTLMMWRIAVGYLEWGKREAELLYESTLDSISEAFDVFDYPISQYMLDSRGDVWEAGLAPQSVKDIIAIRESAVFDEPTNVQSLLGIGGELALIEDEAIDVQFKQCLQLVEENAATWTIDTGALAYVLGAREVAQKQAKRVIEGVANSGAKTLIADGPETAWALMKLYPAMGIHLPDMVEVKLLTELLINVGGSQPGKVFVHDGRFAFHLADSPPNHLAIMPGYTESEDAFGRGIVYEAPRNILDNLGAERVFGTWTRGLAKSAGADDGLWLTHPSLASGLARQRLNYARQLGAEMIVTDSPLSSHWLKKNVVDGDLPIYWLPELLAR